MKPISLHYNQRFLGNVSMGAFAEAFENELLTRLPEFKALTSIRITCDPALKSGLVLLEWGEGETVCNPFNLYKGPVQLIAEHAYLLCLNGVYNEPRR